MTRTLSIIPLALVCASPIWATLGSCPTTSGTAATIASFGAASGCSQIDKNFDNFNVTTSGNNSSTGDPTASNVDIFGTGGSISGSGASSTITPILANFQSTNFSAASGTQTLSTVLDFQAAVNGNSPPTPAQWEITSLSLGLGNFTTANPANTGNSIEVLEAFCLGSATFNGTTSSSNYGYIEEQVQLTTGSAPPTITDTVCTPGATGCIAATSATNLTLSGLSGVTSVGIQETISINSVSGAGTNIYLDSFDNGFGQTAFDPEPGTFMLLGTGLAAAGFLRYRRRKTQLRRISI